MSQEPKEFATALGALLNARAEREEHLEPEVLVAYHHDQLPAAEAEMVQEHLAACRDCADLLLELVRFGSAKEQPEAAPGVADFELEADWRALRARLEPPPSPVAAPSQRQTATSPRWPYALAAGLLLACLGLGGWVTVLQHQLAALRQPQANLQILNLEVAAAQRGEDEPVIVRGTGESVVLILNPPGPAPAVAHRAEVFNAEGRLVASVGGLLPAEPGNFNLGLPRSLLPPGYYQIRLLQGSTPVAEFDLEVAP